MDPILKDYMSHGKHLPNFMRDFHDQKDLFKRIAELKNCPMDWRTAHIYVVDFFLWYMGAHGYELRKVRSDNAISRYDIASDLEAFRKRLLSAPLPVVQKPREPEGGKVDASNTGALGVL